MTPLRSARRAAPAREKRQILLEGIDTDEGVDNKDGCVCI